MYKKADILESFKSLESFCVSENYSGWDPYDGLNSRVFKALPLLPESKIARLLWIQLMKRSPLNLRPVLGISKERNPKGTALFISGYSLLSQDQSMHENVHNKIKDLADSLLESSSSGHSGNCWGYNFDWESRAFYKKRGAPTVVATVYVANALFDAYEATRNNSYLESAILTKDFILKDLNRTYDSKGNFAFSYSPTDKTTVYNASLLGARLLSRIYKYTQDAEIANLARQAVAYVCDLQNNDGSWFYSPLKFHQWIDSFHTGFNLECLSDYAQYTGDDTFEGHFKRGLDYYLRTFFTEKGESRYYNNSLYPIDIHAPSQLIITLSKSGNFRKYYDLLEKVLTWTIANMQTPKGSFYYQINRYYTNRIPYMRWSQSWIFLALAHFMRQQAIDTTLEKP